MECKDKDGGRACPCPYVKYLFPWQFRLLSVSCRGISHGKEYAVGIDQKVIAHNIECHKYHCLFTVKAAYQRNPHKSQVGEYHHQAVAVDLGGGKPHDPGKYLAEQYQHHKKDSHQDKILRNHGRTVCNCFVQDT